MSERYTVRPYQASVTVTVPAGRMTIPSGTTLSAAPLRRAPDRNDDDREDCDDLTDNMASRES
jgi:hypothetical protein